MRAFAFPEFGATPTLQEIDRPEPAAGEVRVRVQAASVNGFDLAVAAGYLNGMMEHRFPVVLGKDFAGTVDAVGPEVTGYAIGDRVFGVVTKPYLGDGSLAEFVTVPVSVGIAPLPATIEFAEAAALGLAGAAAVGVIEAADLHRPAKGKTVLIVGATGGVGTHAVQLAARSGAHVIATAHTDAERDLVTALGASEVVDHTGDVVATVRTAHPDGVDAVVHLAGDPAGVLGLVTPGGRFVSTLLGSPDQVAAESVTVVAVFATPSTEVLERLAADQAAGDTRVSIQRTYPLTEAGQALADFGGGTLGKLVVVLA
jgi:NADPH2:quinone reductase